MGNYRFIHPEQKKLITTMSATMKATEIAKHTKIAPRTIYRVLKRWRTTGFVDTKDAVVGRPRELDGYVSAYIEGLVDRQPDIFLSEIRHALSTALNVDVSRQSISRSLYRRGWTRKAVTRIGRERNEEIRAQYHAQIAAEYPPETHVYLDESHCNRHTTNRKQAWAPIGTRARRHDFFVRGTRYSVLPAISLDGVLHLDIISRSWTAEEFRKYIDCLLNVMNPFPQRNSVLIMDNASTHHFDGIREMVEARMRLLYLPAYSPDLNPIEEGFSAMKSWLRRHRDWVLGELTGEDTCDPFGVLWEAVHSVMTAENITGWFRDSGLLAY
ncbi:hypothetical protein ONZ45_g18152 [Pleurotus djamor]|nr:hypothetical protein ONZ45_g18152 [Pleurotus djamor]